MLLCFPDKRDMKNNAYICFPFVFRYILNNKALLLNFTGIFKQVNLERKNPEASIQKSESLLNPNK